MSKAKTITIELPISTYLKFFKEERISEVEFLPLLEDSNPINKYNIDYYKYTWEERINLLFLFFSSNIGNLVEIGIIYGMCNSILTKSTFIVGGLLEEERIIPTIIITNGFCYNHFDFKDIYYAKYLEIKSIKE
jgi:hypothetical protein